jgi:hypothetical protein
MDKMPAMARQGETKRAVGRQKSQAAVKPGRAKAARTKPGAAKPGAAKPGAAKPGAAKAARAREKGVLAKPGKTAAGAGAGDATVESRLARLEEMALLQAKRSDELFEKVEAVLAESVQPGAGEDAAAGSS